jgi:DNA helicase II / ATP-dependent DNA helicase PcrA
MYLTIAEFFTILKNDLKRVPYGTVPSSSSGPTGQLQGILSDSQTNWILAGPGTGKTETLVLRTLRLLLVDGVRPESIVLTTFTNRAARELFDRLSGYLSQFLQSPSFPKTNPPDISRLWIGTLHSLAGEIMGEFQRTPPSIISEEEAIMLFMKSVNYAPNSSTMKPLIRKLYEDLTGKDIGKSYVGRIKCAGDFRNAVNRIIEDNLDIGTLKINKPISGKPLWSHKDCGPLLVQMMEEYNQALKDSFDFTRLQLGFLRFLHTGEAAPFLKGVSGNAARPGIKHIIVDEYQDSNPIQESIYFLLATQSSATLTVVGDDDQSLYRFRGANPDALVQFDEQCKVYFLSPPTKIELLENRRSHPGIVESLNDYISKCALRAGFGAARSPKSPLIPKSPITGNYASISTLSEPDLKSLATKVASIVRDLYDTGDISHLGQVVILSQSTKQMGKFSQYHKWEKEFSKFGMPLNNPGAKNLHTQGIVKELIGCISLLIDDIMFWEKFDSLKSKRNAAEKLRKTDKKFSQWLDDRRKTFLLPINSKDWDKGISLLNLVNELLGQPVFRDRINTNNFDAWITGWLLRQFAAFDQIFGGWDDKGKIPHVDGSYWTTTEWKNKGLNGIPRGVNPSYIWNFYEKVALLVSEGGHETPSDELVNLPRDQVNALTVHQSKGLSFPIVFVDWRGVGEPRVDSSHLQETQFQPFSPRNHALTLSSPAERAAHDSIRKLFVALSRAQYAVVLCLTEKDKLAIATDSIKEIPSIWFNSLQEL